MVNPLLITRAGLDPVRVPAGWTDVDVAAFGVSPVAGDGLRLVGPSGWQIETVSRGFTRLQDEGVIKVRGRQLRILDPRQLETMALGSPDAPREQACPRSA